MSALWMTWSLQPGQRVKITSECMGAMEPGWKYVGREGEFVKHYDNPMQVLVRFDDGDECNFSIESLTRP